MSLTLTLKPRVSEKTYDTSEKLRVYAFSVPNNSTSEDVRRAVEAQYKVGVTKVNILRQNGKSKRTYRRNGRSVVGKRSDFKKAYVTLKEGDSLPIFASPDDTDKDKNKKDKK